MGRSKQAHPTRRVTPVSDARRRNQKSDDDSQSIEVLGRRITQEYETIDDVLVAELYKEKNGDEIDLSRVRSQQQQHKTTMPESTRLSVHEAQQRNTASQRKVNKESRMQKRRQTAIVDDESSDDNEDKQGNTSKTNAASTVPNDSSSKRQRQVRFQDEKDESEGPGRHSQRSNSSKKSPRQKKAVTKNKKRQAPRPPSQKNTSDILMKSPELDIEIQGDGIRCVKYIGESGSSIDRSRWCREIGQIALPPDRFQVKIMSPSSNGTIKDEDCDSKFPHELPLEAGKSLLALHEYLEPTANLDNTSNKAHPAKSSSSWESLACCVENDLFNASLKLRRNNWVLSIAITEKAFGVCRPGTLPLNRVAHAPKYKQAGWISCALSELSGYAILSAASLPGDNLKQSQGPKLISAKNIYDWTDNNQVTKLIETMGKLPEPSSLEIPGLLPTLRPYQTAAVQWMIERERNPKPSSDEWKLAWIVLCHRKGSPSAVSLLKWAESSSEKSCRSDVVLYCPIVGWMAKSVEDARLMSLGGDNNQVVVKGGILAESMGLGKTVEVLALILAHLRPLPKQKEGGPRRVLFLKESQESGIVEQTANVGDITEFGDADDDSTSDENLAVQSDGMANAASGNIDGTAAVPVTPDGSTDSSRSSSAAQEERWLDENTSVLGSCLCGKEVDLQTKKLTSHIILCCQCHEPMHMECAGYANVADLKRCNKQVTYRKMFSNQKWTCWETRDYRSCPCCVAERDDIVESRATLIITPPAILNQWDREIDRHTRDNETGGHLKVAIYRGIDKTTKSFRKNMNTIHPYMLADHDIVLMTFDSLMDDFGHSDENKFVGAESTSKLRKRKRYRVVPSPLSAIHWWRVCLDEAQRVERPTATSARMALKLKAEHRWCVTGTPVGTGKLVDLYGLLLFLRLEPFMFQKFFNKALDPSHPDISGRIKALLADIFWRSTKANELVRAQMGVPEQQEKKNFLRFSSIEKHFYERQLEATLRTAGDFAERRRSGKHDKVKQLNLLAEHLHRLRAACCHPQVGAGGITRSKKNTMSSESGVVSRVLSMQEILVRIIDDARLKCEESQRGAGLHTNAMAALTRLKVEAKGRGESIRVRDSDDSLLMTSCKLYLEGLELCESNSTPTAVLADAVLSGSKGFRSPNSIMKGGVAIIDWKFEGNQKENDLWSRVDFEGPARRITRLKLRPIFQVPEELRGTVSPDFKWTVRIPQSCSLQVTNPNLGGEFVEVAKFSCASNDGGEWITQDRFRNHKSRSWRIVVDSLHDVCDTEKESSFYVGVEVKFEEADIASDPLQKLHTLHNASLSFASLIQLQESEGKGEIIGLGPFANVSTMKETMKNLTDEAKTIESMYMQGAQTLHKACGQRLNQVSEARKKAEDNLREFVPSMVDCWDSGWWEDFLVCVQVYGDDQQKREIFLRVYNELMGYQGRQNQNIGRMIKFPEVNDLSGLHFALKSRINGIRSGLGKKQGWRGTRKEGLLELREEYFKCSQGMHARCMDDVASQSSMPSNRELYENKHCQVCKEDWNQQGPKCRHCIMGDQLNELEPDRVTLYLLNTIYAVLRGQMGTNIMSQNEDTLNLAERAKAFFDVLEAQKTEKVLAWRFWRTHLDLLNDLDELGQCKESMRLSYEGEDLTSLTRDQLNAVVMPCDVATQYHDHAAKQAMALGDLRRSKETLRYLRNQSDENQRRSDNADEVEQCAVCLCPFASDRAVLRCGHSFHLSPCLERLKGGQGSISCPMRCRVQTAAADVLIASNKRRDDGTAINRHITGSWGTKVTKVVSDLMDIKDLGEKAILFSQWEDMLAIVAEALSSNDVQFARTTSLAKIGDSLKKFRSEECTVLMLNVKKGAEGLTILEARHVLMLEPLLNNALDAQAINRVCRIGQKHTTTVHRYVVEGTVETKIDGIRLEHQDEAIEDTKAMKHAVRAGGVDGGFATEDELMNLLSAATDDEKEKTPSAVININD